MTTRPGVDAEVGGLDGFTSLTVPGSAIAARSTLTLAEVPGGGGALQLFGRPSSDAAPRLITSYDLRLGDAPLRGLPPDAEVGVRVVVPRSPLSNAAYRAGLLEAHLRGADGTTHVIRTCRDSATDCMRIIVSIPYIEIPGEDPPWVAWLRLRGL